MSNRALRKLQAGSSRKEVEEEGDSRGEEDEDEVAVSRGGGGFNAFLLLNADSASESEVKEDDDQTSSRTDPDPGLLKKKKRRKKKSGKRPAVARSSEDNLEEELDEVEASIRWVEKTLGPAVAEVREEQQQEPHHNPVRQMLGVESKHLNPENEMKRIFGSRVISSDNRPRKQRGRLQLRGSVLVTPRPTWPALSRSGLSMRVMESEKEGQWFTWDHSPQYQAVQMQFLRAVESLNPDEIMRILNSHPLHIDSMLQLSEICKMGEDSAMASELIERTLYALESSFHVCFNLTTGHCHLDYRRQENRSFFIALFRHINFVGSKACYRTALELCKILLSLDPEVDPMAAVLMVDFYALRAREFSWLVDLYTAWEPIRNLSQLPNFSYSVALATFHLSLAKPELRERSNQLLQTALIDFPDVLLPLLDKCSIEPDSRVSGHPFFLDTRATSPALATLCALYVERCHHCWKEPEVLPWLESNCSVALGRILTEEEAVKRSRDNRKIRYQGLPRNIHRHVLMSEYKEAISQLPADLSRSAVVSWDPLPPLNSINTYTAPPRQPTALDDPSALRLFFRSLLPNFNPADPQPDGAVGGEGQDGLDLRNSVHSLLEAMRDLLGNIHVAEVPAEAGDEASDDEVQPGEWD